MIENFQEIVDLLYEAMKIKISTIKSSFFFWWLSKEENDQISQVFPYQVGDIDTGIKYLGFHLKSNHYKKGD